MSKLHYPADEAAYVYRWFRKANIDYASHYMWLYISYSAWYQRAVGTTNDRAALGSLKKRTIMWEEFLEGKVMQDLRPYLEKLAEYTQREPVAVTSTYWDGTLQSWQDWRSLIEFWYHVRCLIVHGSVVKHGYVWIAYETLYIFMTEITDRMEKCFTVEDEKRLNEVSALKAAENPKSARFTKLQEKLYAKYVTSPDIWQVDSNRTM